jgi:hypothetical protein
VSIGAEGCAADLDNFSSYGWTPEHHPADRQAVPAWPVVVDGGSRRHELLLRGNKRVSFSDTVSYVSGNGTPLWTDCVSLSLWRVAKDKGGASFSEAFSVYDTMFVTVGLQDGRHVECGGPPAFCSLRRPKEFIPPALPDFPPGPGLPGAPGSPTAPESYPYHVDCTTPTADLGTCQLRPPN